MAQWRCRVVGCLILWVFWRLKLSIQLATYLAVAAETDPFLSVVNFFQAVLCQPNSLLQLATKFQNEYSMDHTIQTQNPTGEAKRAGVSLKKSMHCTSLYNWKKKALHGGFFNRLNKAFVDKEISLSWLNSSRLKRISEGFYLCCTSSVFAHQKLLKTCLTWEHWL